MDWNKVIAAYEYMRVAELKELKGEGFTLEVKKGELVLKAKI